MKIIFAALLLMSSLAFSAGGFLIEIDKTGTKLSIQINNADAVSKMSKNEFIKQINLAVEAGNVEISHTEIDEINRFVTAFNNFANKKNLSNQSTATAVLDTNNGSWNLTWENAPDLAFYDGMHSPNRLSPEGMGSQQ